MSLKDCSKDDEIINTDVNNISVIDNQVGNLVPSSNINDTSETNSIQPDELHEYDLYLDDLLRKHALNENKQDFNETPKNSTTIDESKFSKDSTPLKLDTLTAEFSAFKVQVIKEFLFLKHLIESSNKTKCSDNSINSNLTLENERLKKENETLKRWLDDLFNLSKVNKKENDEEIKIVQKDENIVNEKIINLTANDSYNESLVLTSQLRHQETQLGSLNVISGSDEIKYGDNEIEEKPLPTTSAKKTSINTENITARKKRTDEALSFLKTVPFYKPYSAIDNFNKDLPRTQNHKKVVPGKRTYAEKLQYGKKVLIFGDSHMSRVDRKKLDYNIKGKSLIKSFGGIKSEQLKYYVIPTIKEQDPDRVIIHVGSNNVNFFNVKNKTAEEVAEEILEVGEMCKLLRVEDVTIFGIDKKIWF